MNATILVGDVLDRVRALPDESVQCVVTSPPYWGLRDYGTDGQLGLENTPDEYIAKMVAVFREVRRVLRSDGTLWLNIGDSYASGKGTCYNPGGGDTSLGQDRKAEGCHPLDRGNKSTLAAVGLKPKDLVGIPWMLAFALRADGWWLRQDIIWSKPNPMPESVTDRCTKAHEYLFLLTKSARYYWDAAGIAETAISAGEDRGGGVKYSTNETVPGMANQNLTKFGATGDTRNKRSVWEIATQPYSEAHFATFPEALVEPCILAGSKPGDTVLDPFAGSGTTGVVALRYHREFIGIELNESYAALAEKRIGAEAPMFNEVTVR